MEIQSLFNNLKIIAVATDEIVLNSELFDYAEDEHINYLAILHNLTNKYLSFYNDDMKYDILMKMFTKVFVEKLNAIEDSYDPDFSLYNFLYTIMKNEVIEISMSLTGNSRNIVRTTSEDNEESAEESWDRVMAGGSSIAIPTGLSPEEEEEYTSLIKDYENLRSRILAKELMVVNVELSVKRIDNQIEKLRYDMQRIEGYHRKKYVDNSTMKEVSDYARDGSLLADEATNGFIDEIKAKLESIETNYRGKVNKPWKGDRMKFLDLILADFNFSECAVFFEVSPTSTNKWAKQIQEALYELADEKEFNDNDDELVRQINNWLDDLESEDRVNKNNSEGCPTVKDKAQLYKQIITVYGVDFMNMEDQI